MSSIVGSMSGIEDLYLTENDPQLVRESMPTNLKLMELLIQQSPENPRLLLSASEAFTLYGYAFVMRDAEIAMTRDIREAENHRRRARRLFIRAKKYAFGAFDLKYPGFTESYSQDPRETLRQVREEDVPLLYWTAAAWGSLISSSKDDPSAIIDLPNVGFFLERALELNESFDNGAIHEMMFTYILSQPSAGGSEMEQAKHHFDRALELSRGERASLYVSYAESVSVRNQDREEFLFLLDRALAINVDENPRTRLANILAQERARWLKERVDELFF